MENEKEKENGGKSVAQTWLDLNSASLGCEEQYLNPEEVRHASQNADSTYPFYIACDGKKVR